MRLLLIILLFPLFTTAQKIEAENYTASLGVGKYPCDDVGGGQCVGSMDNGDWVEYNVPDGLYTINIRYACIKDAAVVIGSTKFTFLSTNGWQVWTTAADSTRVVGGKLRIKCTMAALNINWIELAPYAGYAQLPPEVIVVFPTRGDTTYCMAIQYRSGTLSLCEDIKWFRGVKVADGTEYYTDKGLKRDIISYCIKKGAWWPL